MTNEEKYDFIKEICDNLKNDLLSKTHKIPDHWQGKFITNWIAEFYESKYRNWANLSPSEKKQFNNDIITLNL